MAVPWRIAGICRTRSRTRCLPMQGRPLNAHGKFQADFPLHFPPPASGESAGNCRPLRRVAVSRAPSPGDFRSPARKKWEARKNIPHGVWVRVEAPGFGGSHGNRFPCSRGNSRIRRRARTLPDRRGKPLASEVNAAGMGPVASLRICLVARACLWRCKPSPSFHRAGPLSPHFSYPFVARRREDAPPQGAARIPRRAV